MLHVHRATRADALADALAELVGEPPADPFAPDVVAVPTRGLERWLSQRMSGSLGASAGRADGVCANVRFPSPHRLLTDAVATASGIDPDADPWLPERAVWPLLEVVGRSLGEPWLVGLARYLGADADPPDEVRQARRLTAVRHLAGLFDRYALYRPRMLAAWAAGADLDAADRPLAPGSAWQAELWRRLRARLAVPDPAHRREGACARLAAEPSLVDLPPRLTLFGLTRLPAGHLQILRALATGRDVHLFLLHPSPALWDKVARRTEGAFPVLRRADDITADSAANRLLGSWARDAREMQLVLAAGAPSHDHAHDGLARRAGARTLLHRIQDDVRSDGPAPGAPLPGGRDQRPALGDGDDSLQIHSCHGRVRQVEVIRDAILHALAADPTLEPRDVIVMCPDIESFAPLIQATFGAADAPARDADALAPDGDGAAIDLRVRLADRSLRQTNPVLGVVGALLQLAGGRLTASELLDLADRDPVRRRFGFDDDDLTRLRDWIAGSGIRWGLDAAHRAPFRLEGVEAGTWRTGLDRLLLGVTMTDDRQALFAGVLPLDDVDSRSIDLAGRLAELVDRIGDAVDTLGATQPLGAWAHAIAAAADALTATGPRDRWQRAELQRVLDEMVAEAGDDHGDPPQLAPAEVRAHLARRLEGRPTRANFRTGHLTVCTLLPMRSVPHRIVCLLGLDDGAFPRKAPRDGDDLMLGDPHIGERDPRSEDRQLLLDALLAASERLIVTYTGNDERTNTARPPAVPLGELLDVIDATVRVPDGAARDHVIIRHPLQPFDPRNFTAGAIAGDGPWSFDHTTLEGARALLVERAGTPPFLAEPLPPRPGRVLELSDLVSFLQHPVRAFLRQRLGIALRAGSDEIDDRLPVELDNLQLWAVGDRLLEARLHGVDRRTACLAEIARGTLPPGVLGRPVLDRIDPMVSAIVAEAGGLTGAADRAGAAEPVDVRVALPGGRILAGTVTGVHGDLLLTTQYSRVGPKHRLVAWARLLALTAAHPERPLSAATVGRAGRDDVRVALIPPLAEDPEQRGAIALAHLAVLIDLYDRGMREPLPIFCATTAAYAEAARSGGDGAAEARRAWETTWDYELEDRDLAHRLVLGGSPPLDDLLAVAPRDDERGPGWDDAERSRLGRFARRLWDGLLDREETSTR